MAARYLVIENIDDTHYASFVDGTQLNANYRSDPLRAEQEALALDYECDLSRRLPRNGDFIAIRVSHLEPR